MSWKPEPIPFKPNATVCGEPVMVVPSEHENLLRYITSLGSQGLSPTRNFKPLSRKVTKYVVCKKEPCDDNDWVAVATCKSKQHAMEYLRDLSPASYVIKPITIDMNEFEAEPDWDEPPGG